MNKVNSLILSYLQQEGMTTTQIANRLRKDLTALPKWHIENEIDSMRATHNICTEGDYHYIPKESTGKIVMLSTIVIGGLFICPFLLNL